MNNVNLIRDQSTSIPEIPSNTVRLRIWACKYKTVAPIGILKNLKELSVFAVKDVDFNFLSNLNELRHLSLIHAENMKNVRFLDSMVNLETLILATSPSWDSKSKGIVVDSIAPIARLPNLRHLELFGVMDEERSLRDLWACKNIKTAKFNKYTASEVKNFYLKTGAIKENAPDPFL